MWSRNCPPFRSTCVHPRNGAVLCRSLSVLLSFFFWPLYCLSFFWPLYCLSFFWPLYCLSFFFWPLYCLSFFWPLYCLSFFDLRLRVYPSRIFKLLVYCVDHCYFVFFILFWPLLLSVLLSSTFSCHVLIFCV